MVYNPSIPQPTNLISSSQADLLENFNQLNTQFSEDHVALNSASDNGEHTKVTYSNVLVADPNLAQPKGSLYTKALTSSKADLFFQNDNAGTDVRRVMTISAWVAFVPSAVNGNQTITQSENITTVVRSSPGAGILYTFNFTNNLVASYGVNETNSRKDIYYTLNSRTAANAGIRWRLSTGGGAGPAADPIATAGINQVTIMFLGELA